MTSDAPPRYHPGRGLALIGYRGTGKSAVGRIVAERSRRTFLDADLEIEARAGRSIAALFHERGEACFRDWEERTLAELMERFPSAVIATGGGAVLRESNRRRIREFGCVVWLTAPPRALAQRLESDGGSTPKRPALTSLGTINEIEQVLRARKPLYESLADVVVETGDQTPEQVAAVVLDFWMPCSPA
jgi:shikimate kinase